MCPSCRPSHFPLFITFHDAEIIVGYSYKVTCALSREIKKPSIVAVSDEGVKKSYTSTHSFSLLCIIDVINQCRRWTGLRNLSPISFMWLLGLPILHTPRPMIRCVHCSRTETIYRTWVIFRCCVKNSQIQWRVESQKSLACPDKSLVRTWCIYRPVAVLEICILLSASPSSALLNHWLMGLKNWNR